MPPASAKTSLASPTNKPGLLPLFLDSPHANRIGRHSHTKEGLTAKTLMVGSRFWTKTLKGWEEADPHGRSARTTWLDAMVERQVNGAVPPGRYADFLVLDGGPLRDPPDL